MLGIAGYRKEIEPLKKELDEIAGKMTVEYLQFKKVADEQLELLGYVEQEITDTNNGLEWARIAQQEAVEYADMLAVLKNIDELQEDLTVYANVKHAKLDRTSVLLRSMLQDYQEVKKAYIAKFGELKELMDELENKRNAEELQAIREQIKGVYVGQFDDMIAVVTQLGLLDKLKIYFYK